MDVQRSNNRPRVSASFRKRQRVVAKTGLLYLKSLAVPLISSSTHSKCKTICLRSDRLYTIGRNRRCCAFIFEDHRVSKRHCQIFFDSFGCKIFILDGFFLPSCCDLTEIRRRFRVGWSGDVTDGCFKVRASTNGVFVNGFRLGKGTVMQLCAGDEVSFVPRSELECSLGIRIGFVVERVVYEEDLVPRLNQNALEKCLIRDATWNAGKSDVPGSAGERNLSNSIHKYRNYVLCASGYDHLISRAVFLLNQCRQILRSADPISYIRRFVVSSGERGKTFIVTFSNNCQGVIPRNVVEIPLFDKQVNKIDATVRKQEPLPHAGLGAEGNFLTGLVGPVNPTSRVKPSSSVPHRETVVVSEANHATAPESDSSALQQTDGPGVSIKDVVANVKPETSLFCVSDKIPHHNAFHSKKYDDNFPSSGKSFFLNRVEFLQGFLDQHPVVSLPELLHPVESLTRIFIATFTSDVSWFLSYCKVPNQLPMTIACHNTERCWSSSTDKRTSMPYSDYPNLVLVYPPFPEIVSFGKDHQKKGIACHHPKLLVLQREDSIRIVITSANLVSKQWNSVTNTIWWQDFPRRRVPDYSSLFTQISDDGGSQDSKPDFAAQLAGFMASLLADVPSQAHWIIELTKYDFGGAVGHLVASIPGMHLQNTPYPLESMHFLSDNKFAAQSIGLKIIGSVEASVVGLNHRFHDVADSNGTNLKALASILGKCNLNAYEMSEVVLRRNTNIAADENAVSVLVSNLDESSEGDYFQIGFLPRNVAKWLAPLCDSGFFRFSACICSKEVLAAALGGRNSEVKLILYVLEGPKFSEIALRLQPKHVPAICALISSMHRCLGLWRLQELLCRYKWPDLLETDFIYGSSSIGASVNPQFLAAFSAAAGKRSFHFSDSEESDPEWGQWTSSQELRNPSMRIIFPTIERVKDATCGIWPSRHILCFSERTWERLRTMSILHDAIPYPSERIGHPMHVKVARRRFQSKMDASSFGWVYCGSHNFSAAAWGRSISVSYDAKTDGAFRTTSIPGARLHICNYELGIIFVVPPPDSSKGTTYKISNLDDIVLPFVMPAPKYQPKDRPATAPAMREALTELGKQKKEKLINVADVEGMMDEELSDEQEEVEAKAYTTEEREEDKDYAKTLWNEVE